MSEDDYAPDRESWSRGYAQALYELLPAKDEQTWPLLLAASAVEYDRRYPEREGKE
jgi:hypothetical protein